jgi:glycosyltransferase involved in cell wall biosynthesis
MEMARQNELYLLTVQPATDFKIAKESAFPRNVTIISLYQARGFRSVFNILPSRLADAINYRLLKRKMRTATNSYFLQAYPLLIEAVKKNKPQIVVYENLEAADHFSALIKKQFPGIKQIYDAHNVDSLLWKQLANAKNDHTLISYAEHALVLEKQLHTMVDGVFCCSEDDRKILMDLNTGKLRAWVIPNGVDNMSKAFDKNPGKYRSKEILFCGDLNYFPNEEGLLWFYNEVFFDLKKAISGIRLILVGTAVVHERWQPLLSDPAVIFEGRVNDVKSFYYRTSVCIAPLLSGSGTRLKILEAMRYGNPVISTTIGAAGIEFEAGKDLLIADEPDSFVAKIQLALTDHVLYENIRRRAFALVSSKYDWTVIGKKIQETLDVCKVNQND